MPSLSILESFISPIIFVFISISKGVTVIQLVGCDNMHSYLE